MTNDIWEVKIETFASESAANDHNNQQMLKKRTKATRGTGYSIDPNYEGFSWKETWLANKPPFGICDISYDFNNAIQKWVVATRTW